MTSSPLVTVAIPSYNHAEYIAYTIQSILDQTFQDFEILIIDDCSTDNSIQIIKNFKDSRIRLIEEKINRGVCETSNMCIEQAKGKYIALIASDDVMHKTKLEKQVDFLEKDPNYGAVFSGIEIINEDGGINFKKTKKYTKIFEKENRSRFEWLNYFFHHGNSIAATTLLARTKSLKDAGYFDYRITQAHDLDLWIKLCLAGYEIHIIHEKLLQYRERDKNKNMSSNTASTRIKLVFDNEKILENYLEIKSLEDFNSIFASNFNKKFTEDEEKTIINYLLFLEAIKNTNSFYHMQFAASLIYKILGNKNSIKILEEKFNFTLKQYIEFIARNPLGKLVEEKRKPFYRKFIKSIWHKLLF